MSLYNIRLLVSDVAATCQLEHSIQKKNYLGHNLSDSLECIEKHIQDLKTLERINNAASLRIKSRDFASSLPRNLKNLNKNTC